MTAQIPESLRYQGQDLALCELPLEGYFEMGGSRPDFLCLSTGLRRGYVGEWEIVDGRLYLVGLRGLLADDREASLATLFPAYPGRVFAHWYTGTLRVPQGKLLDYVHAGFASVYERDRLLDVDRGVVTGQQEQHNGVAAPGGSGDGYAPGAVTFLGRPSKLDQEGR